ncbi:hypothetical protein AMIS_20230 [Actinoplanes missouriensis 431]|uniref:Uncharacterized protein n=1 Tax=Actinoplanes missouriensis (strain ATCC 14538 / DSM 43046 / CBS 188.64 / JCM 3121 / NBRC 102363 / NCIMB 12654 / NRRL B-3342 / UNCC 431) TaxID=512565 RepID=I0H2K6_ACTM4|nr:hypothetical protein [Actinoplanes missouriensis]BAL87243.1 hypothetical protein AMIS_20230 [Actinoplanes missouriensis 431]
MTALTALVARLLHRSTGNPWDTSRAAAYEKAWRDEVPAWVEGHPMGRYAQGVR